MPEIIKCFKEEIPAMRLIGNRYTNEDRWEGGFGAKWHEWFESGKYSELEKLGPAENTENGCLGFMRCDNTEAGFEYWIGMFFPPETQVPDGFDYLDIEAATAGICWIRGKQDDGSIYGMHGECMEELKKNNMGDFYFSPQKQLYSFERYNCPRFTKPDDEGYAVLDYGIFLAD